VTPELDLHNGVRRCAVLGSPIKHSLSPALHRAAYVSLGLNWIYERVEVDAEGLTSWVDGLDASWRGLSLTMPLKVAVLELGEVDQLARLAGAGNTLILESGSRRVYNTDVGGLTWAVGQVATTPLSRVIIIRPPLMSGAMMKFGLRGSTPYTACQSNSVARMPSEPLSGR